MNPLRWRFAPLLLLVLLLAACGSSANNNTTNESNNGNDDNNGAATETNNVVASNNEAMEDDEAMEDEEPAGTSTPRPTPSPIDDDEAVTLMYDMTSTEFGRVQDATNRVLDAEDPRFVGVFIELLRASQLGINLAPVDYWAIALEQLTGENFNANWAEWIIWYGGTDFVVPNGFIGWKGTILSAIDPGFATFLDDDATVGNLRAEEIVWGGVVVDGIPALDNPATVTPDEAIWLQPEEPVFGIAINGEARAYPLRILDWHEMANDVVGGVPVSLAYCTLCGAAIAYDGRASDGETYTFGSSGFLYRSNKLMYDRNTRTLWNQLTGEPILGELVEAEVTLDLLPVVLTSWEAWQEQHPDTTVVDIDTGFPRDYTLGAAYGDYFSSERTMFPVWQRSELLDNKSQVYVLLLNGEPKAYPIDLLAEEQVVNDEHSGQELVVIAQRGTVGVDGVSLRAGPVEYSAGAEVRVYERDGHTFMPGDDVDTVVDEDGNVWTVTEAALIGPDGEELQRVSGHLAYWFGWFAFFPETAVYGAE